MARRPASPSVPPVDAQYRTAVVRAIVLATEALVAPSTGAVGRRRLVNFLRGNQLPRSTGKEPGPPALFGILESHVAGWVEEAVDRLVEEGYLALAPGRGGVPAGLAVTLSAKKAAEGSMPIPVNVLPSRPRLGSNPEVEERLRAVRRGLAKGDGRAPYGVFPNATLAELAARRPRTLADLAGVPGMGEARVRKYGRRILAAVR